MFYNFIFFAKPSMDFIQLWRDDRALFKILCSTIPIPVHDLKIKVTDFEFFCVKSLQRQLLQSLWSIWIVFGMNGYKILKCFRKEKRVSGERRAALSGNRSYCVTWLSKPNRRCAKKSKVGKCLCPWAHILLKVNAALWVNNGFTSWGPFQS